MSKYFRKIKTEGRRQRVKSKLKMKNGSDKMVMIALKLMIKFPASWSSDEVVRITRGQLLEKVLQVSTKLGTVTLISDFCRILMAADRKDEMNSWINMMNLSLRNLTLWCSRQ